MEQCLYYRLKGFEIRYCRGIICSCISFMALLLPQTKWLNTFWNSCIGSWRDTPWGEGGRLAYCPVKMVKAAGQWRDKKRHTLKSFQFRIPIMKQHDNTKQCLWSWFMSAQYIWLTSVNATEIKVSSAIANDFNQLIRFMWPAPPRPLNFWPCLLSTVKETLPVHPWFTKDRDHYSDHGFDVLFPILVFIGLK